MTLRHFRIFVCVCDEGSMTRTAARLHMTQPSVSQAVRELEEHYGILLFERLGRSLHITQGGQELLQYARHILRLNAQTESAMRSFGTRYQLRIGASLTIGESVLIPLLRFMRQRVPEQEVFSEIHNTAVLEQMVIRDELDLALVEGQVHSEYLVEEPFMDDVLVFVAPPLQKGSTAVPVRTPAEVSGMRFFVREAGSGSRNLFEQEMHRQNIPYRIAGVFNNAEAIRQAVHYGFGAAVLSQRTVAEAVRSGQLTSFQVPGVVFARNFRVVYHRNKYISPELRQLIDACHCLGQDS